MNNRGVVYCATTHDVYLEAAVISALALRQLEPDLPVTIISDRAWLQHIPLWDYAITPRLVTAADLGDSVAFGSRVIKTCLPRFSPYAETLFLDADILPLKPLAKIWAYLAAGDMAMVRDRNPTISWCDHIAAEEKDYTLQYLPGHTKHFNSGVMLWRDNPATQTLFQHWHQEWQLFGKQDQLALVRALHTTQLELVQLPRNYNISPIDSAPLLLPAKQVYLLHCWGGLIGSGGFPQFVAQFYPQIVETVTQWVQEASGSSLAEVA